MSAPTFPPGLPEEFDKVTLKGRLIDSLGQPLVGELEFKPDVPVLVAKQSQVIIYAVAKKVTLDTQGYFEINLPSTDDPDIEPQGWTYQVHEKVGNNPNEGRKYHIHVPYQTDGHIELANIVPVVQSNGVTIMKGDKGDKGDQGIPGIQGPPGAKGDKGDIGEAPFVGRVYRAWTGTAWPVRGTVPANTRVVWETTDTGVEPPPINATYAQAGDLFEPLYAVMS